MIQLPEIQYITRDHNNLSHAEQAKLMFQNGISWVQIRMKNATPEEQLKEAEEALQFAKEYNGTLIINDSIDICKEVGAHGIHLGLKDTPIDEARKILKEDFIIGGTANAIEDIKLQMARGADYVGVGPFRFTTTKKNLSPIIGLEGYKGIVKELRNIGIAPPLVAVGGITLDDLDAIKATGIGSVAISGALLTKYTNE